MLELLLVIIAVVVVVSLGIYLFRTMARLFVVLGVAYLLFHVGFLWDWNEFDSKIPIMDYFKSDYAVQIESFYKELTEKRYENAVLDIDKMESDIDKAIKQIIVSAKDQYDEIDKEKLLNDLYEKMKEYDFGEMEKGLLNLKDELLDSGLSEEEFNEILLRLDAMANDIDELNSRLDNLENQMNN